MLDDAHSARVVCNHPRGIASPRWSEFTQYNARCIKKKRRKKRGKKRDEEREEKKEETSARSVADTAGGCSQ